jgi:hypothetical protein
MHLFTCSLFLELHVHSHMLSKMFQFFDTIAESSDLFNFMKTFVVLCAFTVKFVCFEVEVEYF